MANQRSIFAVVVAALLAAAPATRSAAPAELPLPAASKRKVDFAQDIAPILMNSCLQCHGRGKHKGDFSLDTREMILKGGETGPAAIVGESAHSLLIQLVSGRNPDKLMPNKGARLTAEQVGLLRAWIDQGLAWDAKAMSVLKYVCPLEPRRVPVPAPARGSGLTNPIDLILQTYFKDHRIQSVAVVDDRLYARRVYLDVIGLLPPPDELQTFLADKRPEKRELLVQRLLADNRRYAEHWLSYWNDALRNDYQGTGYIDGGRKPITQWLYHALEANMPYNQFVAGLINPTPDAEGFIKGIVWRGTVNASQTPPIQAAQNIPQVFLATNLKCASCHDSFINDWKLADAYGLANIFSDKPLELHRCDTPTGQAAGIKFIYPQLGAIDPAAPKAEQRKQLAAALTSPANGRFTRAIVNRLWARFLGHGLVEPVDDLDNKPWDPDLLDWLATDLTDHGFDLKLTIARILTSRAYQMPAVSLSEQAQSDYVFRGPAVRRMSAEQFVDALYTLTDAWPDKPAVQLSESSNEGGSPPSETLAAKWIWKNKEGATSDPGGRMYARKVIKLAALPKHANAVITCDNEFTLFVNGARIGSSDDWQTPRRYDLRPHLVVGDNVIGIEAINWPDKISGKHLEIGPSPAGVIFFARLDAMNVGTDASWTWAETASPGWDKTGFTAPGWSPAVEVANADGAPWNFGHNLNEALGAPVQKSGSVRVALLKADALTRALGRPNREQVVTSRPSAATTLQALELTNGNSVAELLNRGAAHWLAQAHGDSAAVLTGVYQRAMGRNPTTLESQASQALVGAPAKKEGVEDLLWVVAMLPEFQLIY